MLVLMECAQKEKHYKGFIPFWELDKLFDLKIKHCDLGVKQQLPYTLG